MAVRMFILRWCEGTDEILIDDAVIREMTADEIRWKENYIAQGLGINPFINGLVEWLDCECLPEFHHLAHSCVKIIKHIDGRE